jgi:sugar-specific transcriptional regulator TrmB
MKEKQIRNLIELGLNRYEAAVYIALLERGDYAPSRLAERAEIPRQRIYDILNSLEQKGFCSLKSTRPRIYTGIEPKIALNQYLSSRNRELREEFSRIEELVTLSIEELVPVYESGLKESDPFHYLEVLRTSNRIARRALELAKETKEYVNSFLKLPLILTREQNVRFIHEPLSRGIRYRSIYEEAALEEPGVRELARTCAELGQEIRIHDHLPVKMHAFDGKRALLSLQDPVGGMPSFTAILTHHAGMTEALNITFATLWETAKPFTIGEEDDDE